MDIFNVDLNNLPQNLDNSDLYNNRKDEDGNIELSDKIFKIYKEKSFQVIDKIKKCGIPKYNEQIRIITEKSFNSISFIELIANNEVIIELILIIFAINISAARILLELINKGRILRTKIIVSSIRNAGHVIKSKAVELLINNGIEIIFINSHAKISALKKK